MATTSTTVRQRGRPSGFDHETALEAAMRAFWAEGYEAASIDRLCRAMNMPRASLYQLFGDKQGLFLSALDRYGDTRVSRVIAALGPNGSLGEDLSAFFDEVIHLAASDPGTPGCLISCVLAEAAGTNPIFTDQLVRRFSTMEKQIEARFYAAGWPVECGIPASAAAGMIASVARGLTLKARSGQAAGELQPVAHAAIMAVESLNSSP
jgi:TetR/AcrR family transcriptional repressor of nem operon